MESVVSTGCPPEQERLLTRGWQRLKAVAGLGIPIIEYPLPEVLAKIKARSVGPS